MSNIPVNKYIFKINNKQKGKKYKKGKKYVQS